MAAHQQAAQQQVVQQQQQQMAAVQLAVVQKQAHDALLRSFPRPPQFVPVSLPMGVPMGVVGVPGAPRGLSMMQPGMPQPMTVPAMSQLNMLRPPTMQFPPGERLLLLLHELTL